MMPETLPHPSFQNLANRPATPRDPLRVQAEELEGVFLNTLVAEMFKGLETEDMFGGGHAEETWRGMLSEQYAVEMARAGGVGLADEIVSSLNQARDSLSPVRFRTAIGAYGR